MECESIIKFDTKSLEICTSLENAFKKLDGTSPDKWSDKDLRVSQFSELTKNLTSSLDVEAICSHLSELDTGITHTSINGTQLSIDIFPRDFPEEFCEYLFPFLAQNNFTEISCYSASEYGNQELEFKNGEIEKDENFFEED